MTKPAIVSLNVFAIYYLQYNGLFVVQLQTDEVYISYTQTFWPVFANRAKLFINLILADCW